MLREVLPVFMRALYHVCCGLPLEEQSSLVSMNRQRCFSNDCQTNSFFHRAHAVGCVLRKSREVDQPAFPFLVSNSVCTVYIIKVTNRCLN